MKRDGTMSDLEKAIDRIESDFRILGEEPDEYTALVIDAARRFASLTSPETIGTIVAASVETEEHTEVVVRLPREYAAELVRSGHKVYVLRSVEEGKT